MTGIARVLLSGCAVDAPPVHRAEDSVVDMPVDSLEESVDDTPAATPADTLEGTPEPAAEPADPRAVLVVYVSGHADATSLHLSGARMLLTELQDLVEAVPVDARVLVLDACGAGELTRARGGTPAAPLEIVVEDRLASRGTDRASRPMFVVGGVAGPLLPVLGPPGVGNLGLRPSPYTVPFFQPPPESVRSGSGRGDLGDGVP